MITTKRVLILLACGMLLTSLLVVAVNSRASILTADAGTIVQFSQSAYSAEPGDTNIPITVTLNQPSAVLVNVDYTTLDGTALAGTDYISKSNTLLIDPGYVRETFNIQLIQPSSGTEGTFIVQLTNPVNANLGTQSSAVVTINSPPSTPPDPMTVFLPYIVLQERQSYVLSDLLLNPGFEEGYDESHPTYNSEWRDNILTPNDWLAWWEEEKSGTVDWPMNNPEMLPVDINIDYYVNPVLRVHSGDWSYKFIRPWGNYNAGFLQVTENLPPGGIAEFSFYAHAWVCDKYYTDAVSCVGDDHFWFRAGIDPTGAIDPWSKDIEWSEPFYIFDIFEQVGPIQATVGSEGKVTVYLAAHTLYPFEINDAYVDTAELTVTVH